MAFEDEQQEIEEVEYTGTPVDTTDIDLSTEDLGPWIPADWEEGAPSRSGSTVDTLTSLGFDPQYANDFGSVFYDDPRLIQLLSEIPAGSDWNSMDDVFRTQFLELMDPSAEPQLHHLDPDYDVSVAPPESTEFEGTNEYWIYGPEYRSWLDDKIGREGLTYDNAILDDEYRDAIAGGLEGTQRPGSPYAGIGSILTDPDVTLDQPTPDLPSPEDTWYRDTDAEFDIGLAGQTPFAPGYLLGEEYGDFEIQDILNRDPWGMDWNLPAPMNVIVPDIPKDTQDQFLAADRFFYTMGQAAEKAGHGSIEDYLTYLTGANPELHDQLYAWYQFHGKNWDEIAPEYFKSAQAAIIRLTERPEYLEEAAGYIRAIQGIAGSLGPALGIDPQVLWQSLEEAALSAEAGESVDMSWLTDPARGVGGGDQGGDQGGTTTGDTGDGAEDGAADTDELPNDVFGSPHSSDASFDNVFLNENLEGITLEADDAIFTDLPDAAWNAGVLGGISDNESYNTLGEVEIPSFVLSQQGLGSEYADPVSYWMSINQDTRNRWITEAANRGFDTEMVSIQNPEGDLYKTVGDTTEFYLPSWAARMVHSQITMDDGTSPDYRWWQSIGASERLRLQQVAEERGMDTELVPMSKIEGTGPGATVVQAEISFEGEGDDLNVVTSWKEPEEEEAPTTTYDFPKVDFMQYAQVLFDKHPELHPVTGSAWVHNRWDIPNIGWGSYMTMPHNSKFGRKPLLTESEWKILSKNYDDYMGENSALIPQWSGRKAHVDFSNPFAVPEGDVLQGGYLGSDFYNEFTADTMNADINDLSDNLGPDFEPTDFFDYYIEPERVIDSGLDRDEQLEVSTWKIKNGNEKSPHAGLWELFSFITPLYNEYLNNWEDEFGTGGNRQFMTFDEFLNSADGRNFYGVTAMPTLEATNQTANIGAISSWNERMQLKYDDYLRAQLANTSQDPWYADAQAGGYNYGGPVSSGIESVGPSGGGGFVPGFGGGIADSVEATVDGSQPARLSSGEFVVPADVVSHLGDGNNQAGVASLEGMMNRVRHDKTGTAQQPEGINTLSVLPA